MPLAFDVNKLLNHTRIKMRSIITILLIFNVISKSCSMSLSKGGLSEGDPAPGRSPGPPVETVEDDFVINGTENSENIKDALEEVSIKTIEDQKIDDLIANVNLINSEDRVDFKSINAVDNVDDKIAYEVLSDRPVNMNPCVYAWLDDDDKEIVNLDFSESDIRINFVHPMFETLELVKGVAYKVELEITRSSNIIDFVLAAFINNEERGEFSTTSLAEQVCQRPFLPNALTNNFSNNTAIRTKISDNFLNIIDDLVIKEEESDRINTSDSVILRDKRDVKFSVSAIDRRTNLGAVLGGTILDRNQSIVVFKWILRDTKLHEKTAVNITFRLRYRKQLDETVYQLRYDKILRLDCNLSVQLSRKGRISSSLLPQDNSCRVQFPHPPSNYALLLELTKFNVPCRTGGFIKFASNATPLCGKLEELPLDSKKYYYNETSDPSIHLYGKPYFVINYKIVDSCFNFISSDKNGSFQVGPSESLQCSFIIHLPYGYRVALRLQMSTKPVQTRALLAEEEHILTYNCNGMLITLRDDDKTWRHCSKSDDPLRSVQIVSSKNNISLNVQISKSIKTGIGSVLDVWWTFEPIAFLVGQCSFGWIWSDGVCLAAFRDAKKQWRQAEAECVRNGGHLMAVRNDKQQHLLDQMLLNSPGSGADEVYWIGATDFVHEGDFRWSNGIPFSFAHWYPGGHSKVRSQPNDDGLSRQDCVEIRRHFPDHHHPSDTYMWNDRACDEHNYYICERPLSDESYGGIHPDCNETIRLSTSQPTVSINSPGFPRQYPDNVVCVIDVNAPPTHKIQIDFDELLLENEVHCSYDFLEIIDYEPHQTNSSTSHEILETESPTSILDHFHFENEAIEESDSLMNDESSSGFSRNFSNGLLVRRLCGDWSDKLKLLRLVSVGSRIRIRFQSDYSHHYRGFKAKISMSNAASCIDPRYKLFNGYCYLFVGYPKVSWITANQVCEAMGAHLASIHSSEEQLLVSNLVKSSPEYNAGDVYWLGARVYNVNESRKFSSWSDGTEVVYEAWLDELPREEFEHKACLAMQWLTSSNNYQKSGLFWTPIQCTTIGGYVCKHQLRPASLNRHLNRSVQGTQGNISSSNFPFGYEHNLDYWIEIVAPESTRILIVFNAIELEFQKNCLYDFVELTDSEHSSSIKRCGTVTIPTHWVSSGNRAFVHFRSDYSISGKGFALTWKSVDISGCPEQTLTAKEGSIWSPNYPVWLLPDLDCSWNIVAPFGKRIFLNISHVDFGENESRNDSSLEVHIGYNRKITPYSKRNLLSDGIFISEGEFLKIKLKTGSTTDGVGFTANYKTVTTVEERQTIDVPMMGGKVRHVNYPLEPVKKIRVTSWLRAQPSASLSLSFAHLSPAAYEDQNGDPCGVGKGWIEVTDNYADENGTQWFLCESNSSTPFEITSFLHTVIVTQCGTASGISLDLTVRVKDDPEYLSKLLDLPEDIGPEFCYPEPCLNDGYCAVGKERNFCECSGFYTGPFCALTACERSPCVFGNCSLTAEEEGGWQCTCLPGWSGRRCAVRRKACDAKPCQGRGACRNTQLGFICKCNPTWKGARCEIRDMNVRYKPLSERMLQEPFWLGLITVFVVMGVIGLVWCAKRHFPEKLEKLLAEEADRCTRRTPSPKKKRNNSTPSKKNAVEKKQILQKLISPAEGESMSSPLRPRRTLAAAESAPAVCASSEPSRASDLRLEKKVTFARLLSRVSAEISSSSEDNGRGTRAASTPPSPGVEVRSTTSSLDFGDTALRRQVRSPKMSSADSILAMLRNFPLTGASRVSSTAVSVSTTPTASSPQDDTGCDEDSFASSAMYSTGYESPAGGPIEVRVVESGRGSASSGDLLHPPSILLEVPTSSVKCLSPIRELPTPLPSPALTPIMPRSRVASCASAESCEREESIELPDDDEECSSSRPESSASSIVKLRPSLLSSLSADTSSWSMSPASPAPPLLTLQRPSPGSPPPRPRRSLPALEGPPLITVTYGEPESDEPPSPIARAPMPNMCYLSPFSVVARADRAPSESNLSSSGYSSMASPGPSRCSSSNPLCLSEAEDPGGGGPRTTPPNRRRRLLAKTDSAPSTTSTIDVNDPTAPGRGRSDSETFSDEPPIESTDEGVGTERRTSDTIETTTIEISVPLLNPPSPPCPPETQIVEPTKEVETAVSCLKPPSIVIGTDLDRPLSAASSRSESPTSERVGIDRFSPQFYFGNRDQLPFTDSDGLYDFPSSECVRSGSAETSTVQRRTSTKRRKKSPAKTSISPPSLLVVPGKERAPMQRKIGNRKQRSRASRPVSSSSSSESVRSAQSTRSVQSAKDLRVLDKSEQSLDALAWQEWPRDDQRKSKSPLRPRKLRKRRAKTQEDITRRMPHETADDDGIRTPHTKINRLRSISNQIRFLRRLEQSLKGKGRLIVPSDDEGDESSSVTSPLLHANIATTEESPRIRILHKTVSLQQEDLTTPLIHKTPSLPTNITSPLCDTSKGSYRGRFQKPVRGYAVDEMFFNDIT